MHGSKVYFKLITLMMVLSSVISPTSCLPPFTKQLPWTFAMTLPTDSVGSAGNKASIIFSNRNIKLRTTEELIKKYISRKDR